MAVIGSLAVSGYNDGPGHSARFGKIEDIEYDNVQNILVVCDSQNNVIRSVDLNNSELMSYYIFVKSISLH